VLSISEDLEEASIEFHQIDNENDPLLLFNSTNAYGTPKKVFTPLLSIPSSGPYHRDSVRL